MLLDVRTYRCKPGMIKGHLNLYKEKRKPAQSRNLGKPLMFATTETGNPNEFLGKRKDLTPKKMYELAKKFKEAGATILGGCCEIRPAHIKEMSKLK